MTTKATISDELVTLAIDAAETAHDMGATVTRPMMRAALEAALPHIAPHGEPDETEGYAQIADNYAREYDLMATDADETAEEFSLKEKADAAREIAAAIRSSALQRNPEGAVASRDEIAEAINKARYVPEGVPYQTLAQSDRRDNEYAYRLADGVMALYLHPPREQGESVDDPKWFSQVPAGCSIDGKSLSLGRMAEILRANGCEVSPRAVEPLFSTSWERDDYRREKLGLSPLGPIAPREQGAGDEATKALQRIAGGAETRATACAIDQTGTRASVRHRYARPRKGVKG